ncbi:hypothetical protein HHL21_12375 [Massilia sp. RP-1-19]|uniref:Methyl-accepting chemotaxis protein n=1 Tax=Massilia polaris TaxID=2728846 RepID=A0A848HLD2_9BURK|nr:hypothetical protein [Massilia polaris]
MGISSDSASHTHARANRKASHEQANRQRNLQPLFRQAVAQMDEFTQQNAALVEESAAAAGSLQEQAAAMVKSVSIFTLHQDAGGPATAAYAPDTRRVRSSAAFSDHGRPFKALPAR